MTKKSKLLFKAGDDWTFETIDKIWTTLQEINARKYQLDFYQPRFEVIDFEGMLNAYSTVALPGLYSHWSYGKKYVEEYNTYKHSHSLAFEVVINSDPSICYLMDSNTVTTQALVIAHAALGHSSFFKGNHLFKTHTDASTIVPFLARSSRRIKEIEEEFGYEQVEHLLDIIHSLRYNSFDKNTKTILTDKQKKEINKINSESKDKYYDKILDYKTLPPRKKISIFEEGYANKDVDTVNDNLLRFICDHSIELKPWHREIINIFLEVNQYLYPQMHTQLMNEGWASFWHYTFMHDLYNEGYIDESSYWEFIQLHCSVLNQRDIESGAFKINPYKLGFDMFQDIKRISMEPTDEDKLWFPEIAGNGDWIRAVKTAMKGYKDESFISQYLSPKVIRDYKFVVINMNMDEKLYEVVGDHSERYYDTIINQISHQYDTFRNIPEVECWTGEDAKHRLFVMTKFWSKTKSVNMPSYERFQEDVELLWCGMSEYAASKNTVHHFRDGEHFEEN